jgi:hypothetical protein
MTAAGGHGGGSHHGGGGGGGGGGCVTQWNYTKHFLFIENSNY